MEELDPAMAARVWQRVRGEEDTPQLLAGLQELAAAEMAEAAALGLMAGSMQGANRALLQKISRQEQSHAACLRGMHLLVTGRPMRLRPTPPDPGTPETALGKCCTRKLKALAQYTLRAKDPEYGGIFAELARQEQEHCFQILEILGGLYG